MYRARRHTVLEHRPCDLKRLPLDAVEGFLLTLIDGRLTLGEIAEVNGMTLAQIFPHADHLLEVGAVRVAGEGKPAPESKRKREVPGREPKPAVVRPDPASVAAPMRSSQDVARPRRTKAPPPPRSSRPPAQVPPSVRPARRTQPAEPARATPSRRASPSARPSRRVSEAPAPPAPPAQDAPRPRTTRKMKAVTPSVSEPEARTAGVRASPSPPEPSPRPSRSRDDFALYRLYKSAKQDEVRRRVSVFLQAAETAMNQDDLVTAASHYRLALQNYDDPIVRAKLNAIEETCQEQMHAKSLARARAAEKDQRWADAATFFAHANAVRAEAWTAERAAHSLRMAGGDLHRALQLAEQAVLAEPGMAAYRLTLGEVCLAANLAKRAVAEAERALVLEPGNVRAKALSEAATKKK